MSLSQYMKIVILSLPYLEAMVVMTQSLSPMKSSLKSVGNGVQWAGRVHAAAAAAAGPRDGAERRTAKPTCSLSARGSRCTIIVLAIFCIKA